MKNSSDTIGNRIRDLPACIAVPQPTAPPEGGGYILFHIHGCDSHKNRLFSLTETVFLVWVLSREFKCLGNEYLSGILYCLD